MTWNLNIVDQLCIFHNLIKFMLLEPTTKQKVATSYVISYKNHIKENVGATKFIARFSFLPTYILSTIYERGLLLHVHMCTNILWICYYLILVIFCFGFIVSM
jgi:hypothetical protein